MSPSSVVRCCDKNHNNNSDDDDVCNKGSGSFTETNRSTVHRRNNDNKDNNNDNHHHHHPTSGNRSTNADTAFSNHPTQDDTVLQVHASEGGPESSLSYTSSSSTSVDSSSSSSLLLLSDVTEITLLGDIVGAYDLMNDSANGRPEEETMNKIPAAPAAAVPPLHESHNHPTLPNPPSPSSHGDCGWKAYAVLCLGETILHQTNESTELGPHPTWTLSTLSVFTVTATPREFCAKKLTLSIWYKRKDPLQLTTLERCCLGQTVMDIATILDHCREERLEVNLWSPEDTKGSGSASGRCLRQELTTTSFTQPSTSRGTVILRFRLAAPCDVPFLNLYHTRPDLLKQAGNELVYQVLSSRTTLLRPEAIPNDVNTMEVTANADDSCRSPGEEQSPILSLSSASPLSASYGLAPIVTELDEARVAQETFVKAVSTVFSSSSIRDPDSGERKIRIKPHADPHRMETTSFLSKEQIRAETWAPSKEWVLAGSGRLGKVYLEILSCHDLPQKDVGEAVGNVTDCFVCAVFEDAMVQTPVIYDELSPHWLPWTQRAFCFGMKHPASPLYVAAFDYDLGLTDHEPIGRVVVNVSHLQRDTDYTLQYTLYECSNEVERSPAGTITIRVRVEYTDERHALMTALLSELPDFHVNVKKEKSLSVVRYTCLGHNGADENNFDLTVVKSYAQEMLQYKNTLLYFLADSLESLILWKGQVMVCNMMIPLHSFLFFCGVALLVERPYLAPSFFFFGLSWILLAIQGHRCHHPSPWNQCPSFWHYLDILRTGKSPLRVSSITANQNAAEAQAFQQAKGREWQQRLHHDQRVAATKAAFKAQVEAIDHAIHTKIGGGAIPIEMLARLSRYQRILTNLCRHCRMVKKIITWEESLLTFWLTAIFFLAGLVSLVLPWRFLLVWTARFLVWGLFGPHMKFVDVYFFADATVDPDELVQNAMESFKAKSRTARLRRQEAIKLKDVKTLTFGSFSTLVPAVDLSRHVDRPLPESFAEVRLIGATAHASGKLERSNFSLHVPGQQFRKGIIPRTESGAELFETEFPRLLQTLEALKMLVKDIQDSDLYKLVNRIDGPTCSSDENLPESIGFELIKYSKEDKEQKAPMDRRLSSVIWNHDSKIAILPAAELWRSKNADMWRLSMKQFPFVNNDKVQVAAPKIRFESFAEIGRHFPFLDQQLPCGTVGGRDIPGRLPNLDLVRHSSFEMDGIDHFARSFDLDEPDERIEVVLSGKDQHDSENFEEKDCLYEADSCILCQESSGLVCVLQYDHNQLSPHTSDFTNLDELFTS